MSYQITKTEYNNRPNGLINADFTFDSKVYKLILSYYVHSLTDEEIKEFLEDGIMDNGVEYSLFCITEKYPELQKPEVEHELAVMLQEINQKYWG